MFLEFAIIGTTASGKSDLAIEIAKEMDGVILSLDSLSIYQKIDIASAKPSVAELASVRHFGVDLVLPNEYFSVGEFIKEYEKARNFAQNAEIPLIITGGSGFYLKAMMSGLAPKIEDFKGNLNNAEIFALASKIDPKFAEKFSQNDTYRLEKWYSIYAKTGEIPSEFLEKNTKPPVIKNLKIFEISCEKEILNAKIATRTQKMFEAGILNEARNLFKNFSGAKPLNSIGLKECGEFLNSTGEFENEKILAEFRREKAENFENFKFAKLKNLITLHTIQLAKRQRTFNASQFSDKISANRENLKAEILKFCENFKGTICYNCTCNSILKHS